MLPRKTEPLKPASAPERLPLDVAVRGRTCIPSMILLLCAAALPARAQQQPSARPSSAPIPTLSVTSDIVALDVVVLDHNKPVCGLKQQDFQVLEDRRNQAIEYFEPHCGDNLTADAAAHPTPKPPPLPANTYDNLPVTRVTDSVTVLLLDGLNTQSADNQYLRQQMLEYLKNLPPGRRIAIFALGSRLRLLQGFTTNSGQLVAAIASQKSTPVASLLPPADQAVTERAQMDMLSQTGGFGLGAASPETIMAVRNFMSESDTQQTGMRIALTLKGMQELARYLSGIPGRKNLIWFSGSFPSAYSSLMNLPDSPGDSVVVSHSFAVEMKQTMALLTAAHIAVYPVDVRGVILLPMYSAAQNADYGAPQTGGSRFVTDAQMAQLEIFEEHSTMDVLAEATGGRAFYEANSLKNAVVNALSDGSNFYTLVYSPKKENFNGAWRKIAVTLDSKPAHGKYKLFYRHGYYATRTAQPPKNAEKAGRHLFGSAMTEGVPTSSQILFKARVVAPGGQTPSGPIDGQNQKLKFRAARYAIDYAVSPQHIRLTPAAKGLRKGSVTVEAVAFNEDGNAVNWISNVDPITLTPTEWKQYAATGLQIHQVLDLPNGSFHLRLGIYDSASGQVGTMEIPLQVGPIKPGKHAPAP